MKTGISSYTNIPHKSLFFISVYEKKPLRDAALRGFILCKFELCSISFLAIISYANFLYNILRYNFHPFLLCHSRFLLFHHLQRRGDTDENDADKVSHGSRNDQAETADDG